ncbi:MAG TPA: PD-(D/E)XK nuclease family protein, partial [Alphaproteobacteria bacterium]
DDLAKRVAPLTEALARPNLRVEALLRAHVAAAEALAADTSHDGAARLWAGEAGEAAARFLDELLPTLRDCAPIRPGDYPELLEALLAGAAVRPRFGTHPRLAILGPLEARLQRFDLMILGSLNEGTWPATVAADPWMSRPMRLDFGLPLAERRIGLSAHDFAEAAMAPSVLLTRALRQAGQPTRPSRWLLRIEAELDGLGLLEEGSPYKLPSWRGTYYPSVARALDAEAPRPVSRPAPCPPVSARPRRISVTQVEQWRRDPYAVYARHILKLDPLEPLDADPAAADLGTALHAALAAFVKRIPGKTLPADAFDLLMREADAALKPWLGRPGVWAFWRPRIARIARWFVAAEAERRAAGTLPLAVEIKGTMEFAAPAGTFTLSGMADRIDRQPDGTFAVVDYKTGVLPKADEIELGFAAQLPLEAVMAEVGAFGGHKGKVTALEYWRLAGRGGGEIKPVKADIAALIAAAKQGFEALVTLYDRTAKTYPAVPRPARAARFNDYVQLARTQEWLGR